jgi:heme-degrading monooxygenase HmoA
MAERAEPLVLINLFSMPPEMVDRFIANWEANVSDANGAPGFRGTRLHRAIDPDAQFPVVNIARWDSAEEWQAAVSRYFSAPKEGSGALEGGAGPVPHPALYTVVHSTPDPGEEG